MILLYGAFRPLLGRFLRDFRSGAGG